MVGARCEGRVGCYQALTAQLASFTPEHQRCITASVLGDNLCNIYCNSINTQLFGYLISQDLMTGKGYNQTQIGRFQLLACHLAPRHTSLVFDIPPKQGSRSSIDFSGVLFARPAPHALRLTHLFSHLSLFSHESYACTLLFPLQCEWMQAKYDCIA